MPWLTPIVLKQGAAESLTRLPRFDDGPSNIRFRHVVHVYRDKAVPANNAVQAITFDTIRTAGLFAEPVVPVDCVAVAYPEDIDLVPPGVIVGAPLQRDVTDVAQFKVRRQLPLLFDILDRGGSAIVEPRIVSDADEFIILTNSDIHLQPMFYLVLAELIKQGYDVITVNRRTLEVSPNERLFSPLFMADQGVDHPGFDCFVFPASMLSKFVANCCCCGAGHVMRSLLFNLVAHAHRFLMLTHVQMTFHLGNDEYWHNPRYSDYIKFNVAQAKLVITELSKDRDKAVRLTDFIAAHEPDYFPRRKLVSLDMAISRGKTWARTKLRRSVHWP